MKKQLLRTLTASILLMSTSVLAQEAPSRTECIAPAKPGGGFDLTCKLIQVSLLETGAIEKPMRVTYMPGGVGAVAYNAIVAKEETFGPLAPLFRFSDEADVIRQANDTEFGLAAYFYARDLSRVFRVGEALEYGIVGINTGIISNEVAPFGGIKASGLGREGSKYGIEDYLEIKYMCIGL